MRNPIKVAITGRIGTGKTTICTLLKKEGFQVFESDKEVRKLLTRKNVKKKFLHYFQKIRSLSDEKGNLNRKVLETFFFLRS